MERYTNSVTSVKTRQQIAAEETQRAIVEAASALFAENGYHGTSIGRIAAAAGVAVQTIYNSVGSKRDLLSRVLDFAAAGDRAPVPVPQFMREDAEREPDPERRGRLRAMAEGLGGFARDVAGGVLSGGITPTMGSS